VRSTGQYQYAAVINPNNYGNESGVGGTAVCIRLGRGPESCVGARGRGRRAWVLVGRRVLLDWMY